MDDMFTWGHQCYSCGYSLLFSGIHCAQQEIFCMTQRLLKTHPDLYFSLWLCSYPLPVLPIPHCSSKIPVSTPCGPFLFILSGLHLEWELFKAKALEADWFFPYGSCLQAFVVTSTINTIEGAKSIVISRMDGIPLGKFW